MKKKSLACIKAISLLLAVPTIGNAVADDTTIKNHDKFFEISSCIS